MFLVNKREFVRGLVGCIKNGLEPPFGGLGDTKSLLDPIIDAFLPFDSCFRGTRLISFDLFGN